MPLPRVGKTLKGNKPHGRSRHPRVTASVVVQRWRRLGEWSSLKEDTSSREEPCFCFWREQGAGRVKTLESSGDAKDKRGAANQYRC
jgi:hypothetical protein